MSEKLLIAKYKGRLIKYSEYQKSIHEGKLYCPFCNPPIRITYNIKGFFMAWKNQGRHNCGKARGQARYLDPEWKGRKLTEIYRNQDGDLEVIIDINTLVSNKNKSKSDNENNNGKYIENMEKDIFHIYKDKVEVFRDVVRSVYQMKRILENNDQAFLKGLKFKFKTNEGLLSLNDSVIKIHELKNNSIGKSRFVIFRVDNCVRSNEIIYVNAYSTEGINLTAKLTYPYDKNPFKKFEGEYAIAYGTISYSDKFKKFFLTLTNDFQIRKLKKDIGEEFFNNIEFEKYDYKVTFTTPKNVKTLNSNKNQMLEIKEFDLKTNIINESTANTNTIQKNNLDDLNKDKHMELTKIKQTEVIKQQENTSKKDYSSLIDIDIDINSDAIFTRVKRFFKGIFSK